MYAISHMRHTYFNNTGRDARRVKNERGKIENLAEMIKVMFSAMKRSFVNYRHSMYKRRGRHSILVVSRLYVQVIHFLTIDI